MAITRCIALLGAAAALWGAEERKSFDQSYKLGGGERTVEIRGMSGAVKVTAGDGDRVEIHVDQRIEADRPEKFAELQREVRVLFSESGGRVKAEVDGPWRCREVRGIPCHVEWDGRGTRTEHEFTVRMPRGARLEVSNVNGAISVDGLRGDYALKTVNGPVALLDAEGAGSIRTVNGKLEARYRAVPRGDVEFRTVNGRVDLWLPERADADFRLKNVNGKIFTDFEMMARPARVETTAGRAGTKWVYRSDRKAELRVGNGGPLLSIEGVNSEIQIHSLGKEGRN